MDISVVSPVHNAEKTIKLLMTSLAFQKTDLYYEVILVENGSNDQTIKIIQEISRNYPIPLKVFRLSQGFTIAKVRNYGAKFAIGSILAFIDSDCEPSSEWLQKGYDYLYEHSMKALLAGGCRPPQNATWVQKAWNATRAGHKKGTSFVHGANFFIPKKLFDEVNGFREELETSEDYDLGCRIAMKYRVISKPQFTVIHYGDVDTLIRKVKKERWYGRSSFELFSKNIFYKPFLISSIFLVLFVCLFVSVLTINLQISIIILTLIIFLSVLLAAFFCYRSNNFFYFIQMVPVSLAFLIGRSLAIIDIIFNKLLKIIKKIVHN